MSYIFVKLQWYSNPTSTALHYADFVTGELVRQNISVGDEFHIRVIEGKYCIGTEIADKGWISCATHNRERNNDAIEFQKLARGKQCEYCLQDDYYACRKYCQGDYCRPSSTKALAMCQPPNTEVYITTVGSEMKVGVSLNTDRRWVEQGSDYGVKVAELPGLDARYLEATLARELGYKLQVSTKKKMNDLQPFNKNIFQEELTKVRSKVIDIGERIKEERGVDGKIVDKWKIIDLTQFYGDALQQINYADTFTVAPDKEFGGQITVIKGSLIVIRNNEKYIILNTKQLEGYKFEKIEKANMNIQTSLSDWF